MDPVFPPVIVSSAHSLESLQELLPESLDIAGALLTVSFDGDGIGLAAWNGEEDNINI